MCAPQSKAHLSMACYSPRAAFFSIGVISLLACEHYLSGLVKQPPTGQPANEPRGSLALKLESKRQENI
jgi:hypothetical protein